MKFLFYFVLFLFRRRDLSLCRFRSAEEARRIAVEDALDELLARDTQYRKELNSHLEKRLSIAEERRRSRVEQFKEVIVRTTSMCVHTENEGESLVGLILGLKIALRSRDVNWAKKIEGWKLVNRRLLITSSCIVSMHCFV